MLNQGTQIATNPSFTLIFTEDFIQNLTFKLV
jgi:hypothetical protein